MIDFEGARCEVEKVQVSVFSQAETIIKASQLIHNCFQNGGKLLWCGNGGSAAEAQHMSAEYMVRFVNNRAPLASLALSTDSSLLTAHSNDFEYETIFARQVEALGKKGDVLIAISTSGKSPNILNAIKQAKQQTLAVVFLVGFTNPDISDLADIIFNVDSTITARVQEGHTLINHLVCEGVENLISDK